MLGVKRMSVARPISNELLLAAQKGDAANDQSLQEVAQLLRRKYQVQNLLISLAAQGMALFDENGNCKVIPTRARDVYDVSGAGDTVIAAASLALAAGADTCSAAEIANYAAGVVVGQLGTATVSAAELCETLANGQ